MKANALALYNALHGTAYQNADDLEVFTMEKVVYIKMKNDVALLVDDSYLNLWEQQSSYNPNMPIRGLMYFGNLYSRYIEEHKLNIYGSKLIQLPTPQYIVFYNGMAKREPIEKLRLSDSFMYPCEKGDFEWTATMYNLNEGKNDAILQKCKPLADYMELINRIRKNQKDGYSIEDAVDLAVDSCIEDDILADFLRGHRAEVRDMCITEFNQEVYERGLLQEGCETGREQLIQSMLRNGKSPETIAEFCNIDLDEVKKAEDAMLINA
jgi:hypothetical protein